MDKIKVDLIYPDDHELDTKRLELSQLELNALVNSSMVGSEGRYYRIDEKIFEDTPSGYSVTIILKEK